MVKKRKPIGFRNPGKFAEDNKGFPEDCDEETEPKRQTELLTAVFDGKLERFDSDRKHQYILATHATPPPI
jgi:hypothetical protein